MVWLTRIKGPGLPGGSIIYQGHLFTKKGTPVFPSSSPFPADFSHRKNSGARCRSGVGRRGRDRLAFLFWLGCTQILNIYVNGTSPARTHFQGNSEGPGTPEMVNTVALHIASQAILNHQRVSPLFSLRSTSAPKARRLLHRVVSPLHE